MSGMIECCEHGSVPAAFVCNHVFSKMHTGELSGFIWSRDEQGQINAYCSDCDTMLESEFGGDWENVPQDRMSVSLYCENCAIKAAQFNGVEINQ